MDDLTLAWIQLEVLGPLRSERKPCLRPLATDSVAAGFPSPADDYIETGIDLNEALIRHPSSTFSCASAATPCAAPASNTGIY